MSSSKDRSLFIPIEVENAFSLAERILFGISCVLHVPALFCLLRVTPPHQAQIKTYLVVCQITVIVSDVYNSIFLQYVFVPEAYAGYCKGIICNFVPPPSSNGLFILTIGALTIATLACIVVRHQAMMPITSMLKMGKNTKRGLLFAVLLTFTIPTTVYTVSPFNAAESVRLINESNYDLDWMRKRGYCAMMPDTLFVHAISWTAIACFIGTLILAMSLFFHMFYVLKRETKTSSNTKVLIRKSLRRLFVQLNVPILFIAIPLIIIFLQFETRVFPIRSALVAMFMTSFHPIVHNLVILLVVPTYRNAIAGAIGKCQCSGKQHFVAVVSVS